MYSYIKAFTRAHVLAHTYVHMYSFDSYKNKFLYESNLCVYTCMCASSIYVYVHECTCECTCVWTCASIAFTGVFGVRFVPQQPILPKARDVRAISHLVNQHGPLQG